MGLGNLCFLRSASRLACSVRSISSRPSLVHKPYCPVRPFVSYSTAANDDDWISSEKAVIRKIESEFFAPINEKNANRSKVRMTPPASFPFKIEEDIPGSRTVTLSREYNGEHIKVVITMPLPDDEDESNDDDDTPSNESNDDDERVTVLNYEFDGTCSNDDDDEGHQSAIPLVVTVTKKSGRSLELRCSCRAPSDEITIDDIHVNLPGNSSQGPKVIWDMDDFVGMYNHTDLKEALNKYLKVRGFDAPTILTIRDYMLDKMKLEYWLWLESVKEFFEE